MKTNLELRAKLVKKYGEEEVRKVETDDFYMGVIPFEEYAELEIFSDETEEWSKKVTDKANLRIECLNTLRIMKEKTTGWHGSNYERLYRECEEGDLSEENMKKIIENHKA
ncbi:MAG: hypothetical protein ACOC2M_01605 [bacterium]